MCRQVNALNRPLTCPRCLSRFIDIHGMVYAAGSSVGVRCEHDWHQGPDYNPNELKLTDDDRAFLTRGKIRI